MKLNVYSIYDDTAKAYTQPFFMKNHGEAVRLFADEVNGSRDIPIKNHPEQFTLYYIGEWDNNSGNLELRDHQSLGKGIAYKQEEEKTGVDITEIVETLRKDIKQHIDQVLAFNDNVVNLKENNG